MTYTRKYELFARNTFSEWQGFLVRDLSHVKNRQYPISYWYQCLVKVKNN